MYPYVAPSRRRAFTLLELLVTIAIIATLLAVLLPAIGAVVKSARGVRCQVALRSVAFDFAVFADDQLHGDRGTDPDTVGPKRFLLETFQEAQYGVDEFWQFGPSSVHVYPDVMKNDPMRCPEVRGDITLINGTPCGQGAVGPARHVSYGFNLRLHRAPVETPGGPGAALVKLTSRVMQETRVPLAWDVDGVLAETRGLSPVFSAPSLNDTAVYGQDWHWFPSKRHVGNGNYAFIDGSVETSSSPLSQDSWAWAYNPARQP